MLYKFNILDLEYTLIKITIKNDFHILYRFNALDLKYKMIFFLGLAFILSTLWFPVNQVL